MASPSGPAPTLLLPLVLLLCSGTLQVAVGGHGASGARTVLQSPVAPRDAAEAAARCCGPASALLPQPPLGHPGPARCCGQGWGLHCCIGAACCLADVVVPVPPVPGVPGVPTPKGLAQPSSAALGGGPLARPAERTLYGSDPWWKKDWAQWLNLGIVLLVVAVVGGILTCCWHRWRRDTAFHIRQQRLLGDSGLYSYGATGPNPTAPHYSSPPMASRWVDFSYKPPMKSHNSPLYRQGPMVSQYYPHPAGV
ncbi:uncharacterized protein LOC117652271 isoform X2 [Thrips palmi]|uniref:Uncharacterized protein LOC117652271 isoform X2 n=1 Tax=Thrips palmi TaxID=161013 RepID=A0A6P9A604_THRPL|nr:uncharacterized protein LOC117652271 isoform X2 [Thrips palmi]